VRIGCWISLLYGGGRREQEQASISTWSPQVLHPVSACHASAGARPAGMSVMHGGGVIAMIVLVIVLVALVPLVVWAAMVDLKRRRLRTAPVNVEARAGSS
jgi:hypothetical protein